MKKIDLGHTITILANVGVIAGIVFLGIEMQQNTRSLEINAYQGLIGQLNEFISVVIDEPDLNQIVTASSAFSELSADESRRATGFLYLIARHGDLAYYQFEQGAISAERLESAVGPLNDRRCAPIFQEFWLANRYNFVTTYRQYVDSKIDQCE